MERPRDEGNHSPAQMQFDIQQHAMKEKMDMFRDRPEDHVSPAFWDHPSSDEAPAVKRPAAREQRDRGLFNIHQDAVYPQDMRDPEQDRMDAMGYNPEFLASESPEQDDEQDEEEEEEEEEDDEEDDHDDTSDDEQVDANVQADMDKLQTDFPGFKDQYRLIKRIGEGS